MKLLLLLPALGLCSFMSVAQGVKISPTPGTPDPSAGLDVDFANKGVLFPRMNSTQRQAIVGPATGLLVYQTDAPEGFWYNAGTPGAPNWVQVIQNPVNTNVDMSNNFIQNLPLPVNNADAVNKAYVDALVASGGGGTPVGIPTMMSTESPSGFTLAGAVNYCSNLTESGHSDWRLPTFDELAYFFGTANDSSYVWTKTKADVKENPLNQNYVSARLVDGKWRSGGEVTSLFIEKSESGTSVANPTNWTTLATYTAINPSNVFTPVSISYSSASRLTNLSSASCCYCYLDFRLKYNYADGSSFYSSTYSSQSSGYRSGSGTTTSSFLERFNKSFPVNPAITPLASIEMQTMLNTTNTSTGDECRGLSTVTISGYEISMPQKDNNSLFVRCVR